MDREQQLQLLHLARQAIRASLTRQPQPELPDIAPAQEEFGGAFVTLHKAGRLRGCIGRFNPGTTMAETVRDMAVAALNDPRFVTTAVTSSDLPDIDIEISILSPMHPTQDPLSLRLGVDGIYIRQGSRSGCFLPQVATEQRWDTEQFLSRCCAGKAGLPADAWRDPRTQVYLFSAEVFADKA